MNFCKNHKFYILKISYDDYIRKISLPLIAQKLIFFTKTSILHKNYVIIYYKHARKGSNNRYKR